ncbi:MAG: hypothetical protein DRN17_00010 [Thermoplasmata archaeon]|nr:MAG: hypothetical protein DRN17_00010 [Thermoplasmata archaeon]
MAKILNKKKGTNVIVLEVETTIDGETYRTNFNETVDTIKSGEYKRHIRDWEEQIKKSKEADLDELIPDDTI